MTSRSSSRAPNAHGSSTTPEADGSLLSNALTAVSSSNISSFSRKVTSTAGSLISPFSDTLVPGNHYHNAMTEISKDLRRPSLQKRIFSFSERTPSEIVRSTLSTTEIQYRALTYLPDDLLKDIPENESSYSLFQGFQASVDVPPKKHSKRKSDAKNLIESSTDATPTAAGSPALTKLNKERVSVNRQLDLLGIRKNIASSEIREIDGKLASLSLMRGLVLERLAKLEQEESQIEHELLELDNRIEDLQYDIEDENTTQSVQSEDESHASESAGFMSESIYGKLPSPRNRKHRVAHKRKSMPILHEHMDPGTNIKELQCHSDIITCHDFDYPFGTLVTAALDDTVRVWDMSSGRCLGMLEGHQASVRCLQVEENFVATGSMDATIRFWDLSRAEHSTQASPKVPSSAVRQTSANASDEEDEDDFSMFSKGPSSTLSTQDCHVATLDAHIGEVTALFFQGRNLVSGSADKTLRQWDLDTGRCIQTLDVLWAAAQSASTTATDDSSWGRARSSKTNLRALQHEEADFIGALQCFDAALACGTADGLVRLWDLRSGQVHRSLVGHTGPVTALQFDDLHLVTGSLDRSIRIWDLRTGSISDAFAYEHPITSMQFDPRRIVTAAGETYAKVYDKAESKHWNCGAGAIENNEERLSTPAVVETVKCKEGYLVEGRRDGVVGIWTC